MTISPFSRPCVIRTGYTQFGNLLFDLGKLILHAVDRSNGRAAGLDFEARLRFRSPFVQCGKIADIDRLMVLCRSIGLDVLSIYFNMNDTPQSVAVLGASDDPDRYSNRAVRLLLEHSHTVLPVTPKNASIAGVKAFASIDEIPVPIDTVTLYVNSRLLEELAEGIKTAHPRRVIFNPGSEHPEIAQKFRDAGIQTEEACTLVLLQTGQF